ncbi:nucleotidyltransferase family protein [uncultured Thalassospira sp.]|uniref:nucleotidyltransferase family protein n=1 Tax=uncultured Thalassospira sp. TaxID=404382 RepID=UPI00258BE34F|nr:nucleotidyltransferase family protein [uncultured Thalassospira sp.]
MDYRSSCIGPKTSIKEAIATIDASPAKVALVVDHNGRLAGTVTDGDVRRGLLSGKSMASFAADIMNRNPRVSLKGEEQDAIFARMQRERVRHLPIVDDAGILVGIETLSHLVNRQKRSNLVVLMVGGEGKRLRPLTETIPKPMLHVGSRPILETIVDRFRFFGFENFVFSVNYSAEVIKSYFGDGTSRGINIEYLYEDKPLDTAGALSLLGEKPDAPFFVMNGDLLTSANFSHILDFHHEHPAAATMCVRGYDVQVPYGVVTMEGHRLKTIQEKPVYRKFTNAGIYVLEPEALDVVEKNVPMAMPQLFERLMESHKPCNVCPIREYWLDIGQHADFERANLEYPVVFNDV